MKKQTRKQSQSKSLTVADLGKVSGGLKPIGYEHVALKPIGYPINIGNVTVPRG